MHSPTRRRSVARLPAQGELTPEHSAALPALPALAERLGARFVLNLAPVTTRDRALLASADPLIVNETEAADVLGMPRDTLLDELFDAFAAAVDRCRDQRQQLREPQLLTLRRPQRVSRGRFHRPCYLFQPCALGIYSAPRTIKTYPFPDL